MRRQPVSFSLTRSETYPDSYKVTCAGTYEGNQVKQVQYLAPNVGGVRTVQEGDGVIVEMNLMAYSR